MPDKTALTIDLTGLVPGQVRNSGSVRDPLNDLLDHIKHGYVSMSSGDPNVDYLGNKLLGGTGITLSTQLYGGTERMTISADTDWGTPGYIGETTPAFAKFETIFIGEPHSAAVPDGDSESAYLTLTQHGPTGLTGIRLARDGGTRWEIGSPLMARGDQRRGKRGSTPRCGSRCSRGSTWLTFMASSGVLWNGTCV